MKVFLAGVQNSWTKNLTNLNIPVRHSSSLDQRHWTHGYRRLTVCSMVRPSCWLWRTEDRHDDLLTQWQAYTVQSGTLEPCRADTDILLQPLAIANHCILLICLLWLVRYWFR